MTASPLSESLAAFSTLPTPERAAAWHIVGHLLGRKEGLSSIAHAVNLPLQMVERLCDLLCVQGKLSVQTTPRGCLYSVSATKGERI